MKKRLIIIDRDGTIIKEPKTNFQVENLDQLSFVPGAIGALRRLCELRSKEAAGSAEAAFSLYGLTQGPAPEEVRSIQPSVPVPTGAVEIVMASNQDGVGAEIYPWSQFVPVHGKMLEILSDEGIVFNDQLLDCSFSEEKCPTRKPGTGMFESRIAAGNIDWEGSVVIGDRLTDMRLARALGCKGILLMADPGLSVELGTDNLQQALEARLEKGADLAGTICLGTTSWAEAAAFVCADMRTAVVARKTKETDINLTLNLDGFGESRVDTGLKFFDHMLEQIIHHGGVAMSLVCRGDLEVDEHHTIEDCGLALGEALKKAIGDKRGMDRYGFALPMDEAHAEVLLDFGGRSELVWNVTFTREYVGDVPTEMFQHFFKSVCNAAACNLYISAEGENNHHIAEAVFKGFARAVKAAVRRDVFSSVLPSSKGML